MTDPRIVLKTTPPRAHRTALRRDRLAQLWEETRDRAAVTICAPAGFGKTTLLVQWRRLWLEHGAIVAWVSLDSQDVPGRFALTLLHAMRVASGRAAFDSIAQQAAEQPSGDLGMLTALLAEIASLAAPTVLILDDAETLPAETAGESLGYLLFNAPPNLHVLIGSRTALTLPTSELTAHGDLATLGARELRLELDESIALLRQRFGQKITLDDCVKLHEAAEGWPIGLQLAAASIERAPDLHVAIDSLSARHGDIERYFVESLFERLPPRIRDLLIRISILDRIEPELCAAVTGSETANSDLDGIQNATPILIVSEMRDWIRVHPLARDFLLGLFERLPPVERHALHRRAAAWLAERGRFHEAGRHALDAGDAELARSYAKRSLFDLASRGYLYDARLWIDQLPADAFADDRHTQLVAGWIMALTNLPDRARSVAERALADPELPDRLRFEAMLVAGCAAAYSDQVGRLGPLLALYPDPPAEFDTPVHAVAYANTVMVQALAHGQTERVRELAEPQLALRSASQALTMAVGISRTLVALSHLWDGNAYRVDTTIRPALADAERQSGRRNVVAAGLYAPPLAAALLELGEAGAARAALANRLDVVERAGFPDTIILAYRTLADLAEEEGDERSALEYLAQLQKLGENRQMPRLVLASLFEQIRVHALRRRNETVRRLQTELALRGPTFERPEFAPFLRYYQLVTAIASAYAALGRLDVAEASRHLAAADTLATSLGRGRDALTVKVLRAVVARESGDAGALALLAEAQGLAELSGNRRLLTATHPIAVTMEQQLRAGAHSGLRSPVVPDEGVAAPRSPTSRPPPAAAGGLLTPKEAEVLNLLSSGMSNKLIAKTMDISDETVKWHLKNLFSKLDAGTRRHAVDRARLFGLIPA